MLIEVELSETVRETLARATMVREKRWESVSLIFSSLETFPVPSVASPFARFPGKNFAYMG